MTTIPTLVFVAAFALAALSVVQANGRSAIGWATLLITFGLLWGRL